jgi:hypothetical protein
MIVDRVKKGEDCKKKGANKKKAQRARKRLPNFFVHSAASVSSKEKKKHGKSCCM